MDVSFAVCTISDLMTDFNETFGKLSITTTDQLLTDILLHMMLFFQGLIKMAITHLPT